MKTSPIETLDLMALKKLAHAATPGPIDVNRFDETSGAIDYQLQQRLGDQDPLCNLLDSENPRAKADAELWAVARESILALIERVEKAERNSEIETRMRDIAERETGVMFAESWKAVLCRFEAEELAEAALRDGLAECERARIENARLRSLLSQCEDWLDETRVPNVLFRDIEAALVRVSDRAEGLDDGR